MFMYLAALTRMDSLAQLDLRATKITDVGVMHLGAHRRLQSLDLSETQVSEKSFRYLAKSQSLKRL